MQIAGRDTYNDAPYAIGIAPEGASHFESLVLQGLFDKNKTNETTKLYHSFVRLWYGRQDLNLHGNPLEPKSNVSANSTTPAFIKLILFIAPLGLSFFSCLPIPPVAILGALVGVGAPSSFADRGHSLWSLVSAIGGAPIAPHARIY